MDFDRKLIILVHTLRVLTSRVLVWEQVNKAPTRKGQIRIWFSSQSDCYVLTFRLNDHLSLFLMKTAKQSGRYEYTYCTLYPLGTEQQWVLANEWVALRLGPFDWTEHRIIKLEEWLMGWPRGIRHVNVWRPIVSPSWVERLVRSEGHCFGLVWPLLPI